MSDRIRLEEFGKQLVALERSLRLWKAETDEEKRLSFRSAVVNDFQLAFELCWKAVQELAYAEGETVRKPKEALTFLLDARVLSDRTLFEGMIDSRNRSIHAYGQTLIDRLLPLIESDFAALLHQLHDALLRYYSKRRA